MTKNKKKDPCFASINGDPKSVSLSTEKLFKEREKSALSPIDIYVKRNKALIKKLGEIGRAELLDSNSEEDSHIYNLFLLGFISNVESYFRSILREIIVLDPVSYTSSLGHQLTYAAALHHDKTYLPEALLENRTFISAQNITDAIKDFTNISVGKQDAKTLEVKECLDMFEKLCQLRHCIVHRAGLLGSKNAVKLGIKEHKSYFEKPITLDIDFLLEASVICLNSVRVTNSFLFNKILHRFIDQHDQVKWNFHKDKKWYSEYYKLFASDLLIIEKRNSGNKVESSFSIYQTFRAHYSSA